MSSTKAVLPARWRAEFLNQLSRMPTPEFVFTSLHTAPSEYHVKFVPRARTCVFRGMWTELSVHRNNTADLNEKTYQSDLLAFTSDVRMNKIPEIFSSSSEKVNINSSGGNGPVEALFWIKETKTQWRFKGEAFVVGIDIDDESSSGARTVKRIVGERMRLVNPEAKDRWSWSKELTAHFGNLSPQMRGTFKNPSPGAPISTPIRDRRLKLGQEVDDLHDEVARENFRVIIIKPYEVEKFYLGDLSDPKKLIYTYVGPESGEADGWKDEEVWP
ncbi:putative zn 2cys6 transcription factor protein [Golovinomyces cichoracearum]|uniref:Putative zn 2cys6 transcription factor protein n=1 Tax=Golovinomyces cichoracearum TaxID=62708 RepID=A0A420HKE5_9PEZI|nr:putative zn 2cys6 transcription factor protein [Golovinomyces cichoracearum]